MVNEPEAAVKNWMTVFLKNTGYSETNVLSSNPAKRTVVTSNGGKYQVMRNGRVRTLSGPSYPKEQKSGEEE